jgi:hypothetical protein
VKVIKRERSQAIALALGRKCRKHSSGRFIQGPALQLLGVLVETRWCMGIIHQIYLVFNYLIIEMTLFVLVFNLLI